MSARRPDDGDTGARYILRFDDVTPTMAWSVWDRVGAALDRHDIVWVPQRLWRLEPRRRSVWTVFHHLTGWTDADMAAFERDLERLGGLDRVAAWSWRTGLRARQRAAGAQDLILGRR